MSVFKFSEFINESNGTEMTLYRVVPIKDKDKLDVNSKFCFNCGSLID